MAKLRGRQGEWELFVQADSLSPKSSELQEDDEEEETAVPSKVSKSLLSPKSQSRNNPLSLSRNKSTGLVTQPSRELAPSLTESFDSRASGNRKKKRKSRNFSSSRTSSTDATAGLYVLQPSLSPKESSSQSTPKTEKRDKICTSVPSASTSPVAKTGGNPFPPCYGCYVVRSVSDSKGIPILSSKGSGFGTSNPKSKVLDDETGHLPGLVQSVSVPSSMDSYDGICNLTQSNEGSSKPKEPTEEKGSKILHKSTPKLKKQRVLTQWSSNANLPIPKQAKPDELDAWNLRFQKCIERLQSNSLSL